MIQQEHYDMYHQDDSTYHMGKNPSSLGPWSTPIRVSTSIITMKDLPITSPPNWTMTMQTEGL